ncbi:MAG: hypothetical protein J0H81_07395 [Sphingopyxis terrae]|nr:hypothetical protein [Sphingopyxis terrae]
MAAPEPSTMTPTQPGETRGEVVPFPGRTRLSARPAAVATPVRDVGTYERSPGDHDDFAHRMIVNAAGLAVCAVIVISGVWIANKMADLRRDQDCVLSGRRNCAQIVVNGPVR